MAGRRPVKEAIRQRLQQKSIYSSCSPILPQHPAVNYRAQENPPVGEQEEEAALLFKPLPELEGVDENVDSTLSVSASPHEGQVALSPSSLRKQKNSKTSPHFLQLNS